MAADTDDRSAPAGEGVDEGSGREERPEEERPAEGSRAAPEEEGADEADGGSLRGQLLAGLAVLLVVALLALAAAGLVWLSLDLPPALALVGLAILIVVDVTVLVVFGDYLLRRLVTRPVERMVDGAEAIAAGVEGRRIEPAGSAELRRLARSVNRMADRLIRRQRALRENIRSLDETNRALTEAKNELVQAEKLASVGRLAAGIAHEVGNPLNAIMGYLELARRRGRDGDEWLEGIGHEARRIDRIVRGLLDYARPKSGERRTLQVNEVVRRAVDLLETQGKFKEIRVRTELEDELPELRVDPNQLQQVLVNVLLNSVDAIEEADSEGRIDVETAAVRYEGPRTERLPRRREDDPEGVDYTHLRRLHPPPGEIQPRAFAEGERVVRIRVSDDGRGFPEEDRDRLFDPFYTTKEPGRGTGLGLAVSARLVAEMSGTIRAEGKPGEGAVFTLLLPIPEEDGER